MSTTLKANAGFVRFNFPNNTPPAGPVQFQVGVMNAQGPLSISSQLAPNFTAFQCAVSNEGDVLYDTVVYISNRNGAEIQVDYKITNAETGLTVVDSFVKIGPFKMLAFSLIGALK